MTFESFKKLFGSEQAETQTGRSPEERLASLRERRDHILTFVNAGHGTPDDARILDDLEGKIAQLEEKLGQKDQ